MPTEEYAASSTPKTPAVTYGAVDSTSSEPPPPRKAMPWLFERPTFLQKGYMCVFILPLHQLEGNTITQDSTRTMAMA